MKRALLCAALFGAVYFSACQSAQPSGDGKHFGKAIDATGAMPVADMLTKMQQDNATAMPAKISGKVLEVCQKKGCWMTIELPNGEDMRVTFKDYGFFMPKDISGKTIAAEGIAETDTVSVEMLQHYAEDEGKPAEEIAKITEPEIEISFVADGVVIE